MKSKHLASFAAVLASFVLATTAFASGQRGGTCISVSEKNGNYPGGASSLWNCEHIGLNLTVKQIYEKGFKVVAIFTPLYNGERIIVTTYTMIIEEQK